MQRIVSYLEKAVMSHVRDIRVIHTVDRRVFFDIPLYFDEKALMVKECRIESGRIVIETIKPKTT
jgi:hypothetical protein